MPSAGGGWPDDVKERALELLRAGHPPADVRRILVTELGVNPSASTIRKWRHDANIPATPGQTPPADPNEASAIRLARLAKDRERISEALLRRLTGPAVELIARRLEEEVTIVLPRVNAARQALDDATLNLSLYADESPESPSRKAALAAQTKARLMYELESGLTIPLRDLVGVTTRAIVDHLALEGLGAELEEYDATKAVTIELVMPRPDPAKGDRAAILEDDLTARDA